MAEQTEARHGDVGGALDREMDRLSLEQALRDFEIANSRVIDLTQRLITSNDRAYELQRELDVRRGAHAGLGARYHAIEISKAYRLADKLRTLRNLLRP